MTAEQLEIAKRHQDYHRQQFGHSHSNVEFRQGYLEKLADLDLADNSFDIVVSNCVLNLCIDKTAVLEQVHRLLKPGGEFYFSDIYADRRLPVTLQNDPVLYGECLAGALYWNDFVALAKTAGFADPRLVEDRPLTIDNDALAQRVAPARFHSATYRLFKIAELEPACEDYGQAVIYQGTVPDHSNALVLDKHHVMATGRVFPVCGNSYRMLHDSRFAPISILSATSNAITGFSPAAARACHSTIRPRNPAVTAEAAADEPDQHQGYQPPGKLAFYSRRRASRLH